MRLVLKIGGSILASPINLPLIKQYIDLLKDITKNGYEVATIIGGGNLARKFIRIAKELGLNETVQDEVAISISRIFANLLLKKLGNLTCKNVPLTIEEADKCLIEKRIIVMGGLRPGMTTDTVAALLAKRIHADLLVKATDQEGIYNTDPKKQFNAFKYDRLRFDDLSRIFQEKQHKAGLHQILDPEAIKILKKMKIKLVIVNGFKPENVLSAIKGKKVGTVIV